MDTTLSGFSQEFMDLVKENAIENQQSIEQQLTEDVIEYIKEEGFAFSPEMVLCENKNSARQSSNDYYKINAFDYSEDAGILDLYTTCYIESENVPDFSKSRIQQCQNQIIRFLSFALTDPAFASSFGEDEADIIEIIELIKSEFKAKHVNLVRFFIISNGIKKYDLDMEQTLTLGDYTFDGEFHIWDMETIRRSDIASRSEGAIDIDFATYYNHSIDCLELAESDGVKSYLAIIPAIILAKVFHEYKARLLNQNVRNYLGGKIKVNRGMAETLRKTPGLFFAYNNGISSTANGVTTIRDEETGRTVITNIRNWQIVNGGQTTNTIYSVWRQNPELLTNVFVTMKLSEIKLDSDVEKSRAISNIARYANSQTQIKESDLSANIDYMVKMQEFSRSEWAPATSARKGTQWFFERMRGQYETEAGDKKTKKYKVFIAEHPKKTQRFVKTDIAKWEMAWGDEPYTASKGGEQCYDQFYKAYLKGDSIEVTKEYFHELIAKAILYQTIGEINKQAGVKAYINIICNYVLATISAKSRRQLDFDYIWEHQEVHPDMIEYIAKASQIVNNYITLISQQGDNPSVKAKNVTFSKEIALRMANMTELPKTVIKVKEDVLTEVQKRRMEAFAAIKVDTWKELASWGKQTKNLSLVERKRIDHVISYLESDKTITFEHAKNSLEILEKSYDLGFPRN